MQYCVGYKIKKQNEGKFMIKHIVMWKFKEVAENNDKISNIELAKEKLLSLEDTVEVIRTIEVGINIKNSEASFDLVLLSEFENQHDLAVYQNHAEHKKVAEFIGKARDKRVVVDYEI